MLPISLALGIGAALMAAFALKGSMKTTDKNTLAFLALIRESEAGGRYDLIAGGDVFTDFSEHPFNIDPKRRKLLGTTASGAYQMVRGTWNMARDALELDDFSPASQDAAAIWILKHKIPGQNKFNLSGNGLFNVVERGDLGGAIVAYRSEWEAFAKMLEGKYPITLTDAAEIFQRNGGNIA